MDRQRAAQMMAIGEYLQDEARRLLADAALDPYAGRIRDERGSLHWFRLELETLRTEIREAIARKPLPATPAGGMGEDWAEVRRRIAAAVSAELGARWHDEVGWLQAEAWPHVVLCWESLEVLAELEGDPLVERLADRAAAYLQRLRHYQAQLAAESSSAAHA